MIPWVIENYWEYGILAILFVGMFFLYNRCRVSVRTLDPFEFC